MLGETVGLTEVFVGDAVDDWVAAAGDEDEDLRKCNCPQEYELIRLVGEWTAAGELLTQLVSGDSLRAEYRTRLKSG